MNLGPKDYESSALTAELMARIFEKLFSFEKIQVNNFFEPNRTLGGMARISLNVTENQALSQDKAFFKANEAQFLPL